MALSASLLLRQNQSLVMTPQLMQSIQLLQMTHIELTQFIAQEVEKNPLLEIAANDSELGGAVPSGEGSSDLADVAGELLPAIPASERDDWYGDDAPALNERLDTNFENVFQDDGAERKADAPELLGQWKSMPGGDASEGYDLDDFVAGKPSLRDHILQQLPFAVSSPQERVIADALIDHLDDTGYIDCHAVSDISGRLAVAEQDAERILCVLQGFDPPGVFARSLSECLSIQLAQKDRLDPAMQAFVAHLELLAKRDFATLKKLCGVDEEDLLDMLAEIRTLNPRPGAGFEGGVSETIVPDIIVRPSSDGGWLIELNPETLPRVLVNQTYFAEVSKLKTRAGEDGEFLTECMQTANWLTRSLDQRAKTIMKVATEIVRQQDAFLLHGVDHLRPLNLKQVADAIKMHESTVSRVTSKKYMLTPRGVFELKYFFSVSIGSVEGGDNHSAEAVRHRIRTMIALEAPEAVLSDDDIVEILKKNGVDLARRTVAKYREAMNIPSSVQRRREKKALARVAAG
ncbi:RNA polymerase factor sigma-54 [Agrobacterium larrymoorei]|uniref:RNA polymerase factor sigma-54 n=1 Tax=Agrobacterium larrymoorei TaxID=160699 RepID=UPI0015731B38|nr:RNA polymerase factor sigma-54 [Agrobacterium larrymoorei]NTJ41183.1 RNA polymerase factor sigma-54 [Agrobacterium larrymoorei]